MAEIIAVTKTANNNENIQTKVFLAGNNIELLILASNILENVIKTVYETKTINVIHIELFNTIFKRYIERDTEATRIDLGELLNK